MKLKKCSNKHFFDADQFNTCPHCEKAGMQRPPQAGPGPMHPNHPNPMYPSPMPPGRAIEHGATPMPMHQPTPYAPTGSIWDQNDNLRASGLPHKPKGPTTEDITPHPGSIIAPNILPIANIDYGTVTRFCGNCGSEIHGPGVFCIMCGSNVNKQTSNTATEEKPDEAPPIVSQNEPPIPKEEPADTPPDQEAPSSSLQSQISAVSSHGPTEDVKTMAFYNFTDTEPVVGWLVSIKGEYLGQSFNLKAGQNFIGRSLTMDIPLAQDTSISRNKHAIITFDPENRKFFAQPGESGGLTYLNNELVLAFQPINAYDKVKVGNSEFIFVPCCGEEFSWEDYIK